MKRKSPRYLAVSSNAASNSSVRRWEDYVAHLKTRYSREQILKDYGVVLPYPGAKAPAIERAGRRKAKFSGQAAEENRRADLR